MWIIAFIELISFDLLVLWSRNRVNWYGLPIGRYSYTSLFFGSWVNLLLHSVYFRLKCAALEFIKNSTNWGFLVVSRDSSHFFTHLHDLLTHDVDFWLESCLTTNVLLHFDTLLNSIFLSLLYQLQPFLVQFVPNFLRISCFFIFSHLWRHIIPLLLPNFLPIFLLDWLLNLLLDNGHSLMVQAIFVTKFNSQEIWILKLPKLANAQPDIEYLGLTITNIYLDGRYDFRMCVQCG